MAKLQNFDTLYSLWLLREAEEKVQHRARQIAHVDYSDCVNIKCYRLWQRSVIVTLLLGQCAFKVVSIFL